MTLTNLTQLLYILIVFIPLGLAFANRLRVDVAALVIAVLLGLMQWLGWGMLGPAHTPAEAVRALAGFSQPIITTLIGLFILTRALDHSGVTRWLANGILRVGGSGETRLIVLLAATTALLSLVMNNLAAVALVLPGAMEIARRTGIKPSRLLIPVSYGSLLGGSATYFTTANIILSDLLTVSRPPQAPLGILDFTPTGGLILLAGLAFLALFGRRLLPAREPAAQEAFFRLTGSELETFYQIGERLWEASVPPQSPLVGRTLGQSDIGRNWGVTVVGIQRSNDILMPAAAEQEINAHDSLILVGRADKIEQLVALALSPQPVIGAGHLSPRGLTFAEVIVPPHSRVEGQTLKDIGFRQRSGLTAVALKRLDRSYRTDVGNFPLRAGDSLLTLGPAEQLSHLKRSADFLVIEPNPADQPVDRRRALLAVGLTLAAVTASIAGVPVYLSVLAAAALLLLSRDVSMEEAYRSIEWQAIFLIAGMYAAAQGMVQTGLAAEIGHRLIALVGGAGPLGLAAGAYLLSALLTQFMGGQVTALVTGPVVISAALTLGIDPHAAAVSAAIGCSASYLTPIAHPANILVIAPGNYRFSDFTRIGLPLFLLSFAVMLAALKLIWGL